MDIRTYERIEDMLCEELDKIAEKGEMSSGDLDTIYKILSSLKNNEKVMMMADGDYSMDGDWDANIRGSYGDSSSYARGGRGGRSGGYSSRRGGGRRRDSMGRYSRDGSKEDMIEHIDRMMDEAPDERTREIIREFKEKIVR